jgi:exodeoxyribonuclease VII large subunit
MDINLGILKTTNTDIFSISELNQFIKDVVNSGFPQSLWIHGEIQGFDRNKDKNHIFFELVEKDPTSKDVQARIGLVIFANRKYVIETILKRSENAFSLKDDIEVKFLCKVDFYTPHGAVRLVVESIDPIYTLGKIAQEKQKLIALLQEKGVLDKNKEQTLAHLPLSIGLITSYDSAAYNDFCSELSKSGYKFVVHLRNTLMQGKRACADVCRALDEISKIKDVDCVVITRGGGSIAELSCFDDQLIAEKIASYRVPVLSGIGHEINITITDLASHTFAKTPTAIAQFLITRIQKSLLALDEHLQTIAELAQSKIEDEKLDLKDKAFWIHRKTHEYLKQHREKLLSFEHVLKSRPTQVLKDIKRQVKETQIGLLRIIRLRMESDRQKLKAYSKLVDMASPINTMKRGFVIARTKGKILKSIKGINIKDEIELQVADGILNTEVKSKMGAKNG